VNELEAIEAALRTYASDSKPAVLIDGSMRDVEVIREALCANSDPGSNYALYVYNANLYIAERVTLDVTTWIGTYTSKKVTVQILTRLLLDHFNVFKLHTEPLLGMQTRQPALPSMRCLSTVLSYSSWPGVREHWAGARTWTVHVQARYRSKISQ
jgi:hypothetical protein